jgi:lipopolysaccharide export system protein LptA
VATDQIAVDATRIEVVLGGPTMHATGNVKSVLQPPKKSEKGSDKPAETKIPSMLKQNQPVNVTAASLRYDGAMSGAIYEGAAQLWQGDTSIKGDTIGIDSKTGDISASGSVVTTTMLDQVGKDQKKERVRNMGTSKEFKYEDALRRATYTGEVHLNGPSGDVIAEGVSQGSRAASSNAPRRTTPATPAARRAGRPPARRIRPPTRLRRDRSARCHRGPVRS